MLHCNPGSNELFWNALQHQENLVVGDDFTRNLPFRLAEVACSGDVQGMVAHVLASLAAAGAAVLAYGLLLIVQPHPWWDAQHSLPILAMLLGITISAVSTGLSAALNDLAQGDNPPQFP